MIVNNNTELIVLNTDLRSLWYHYCANNQLNRTVTTKIRIDARKCTETETKSTLNYNNIWNDNHFDYRFGFVATYDGY